MAAGESAVADAQELAVPVGGGQPDFKADVGVGGRLDHASHAAEGGELCRWRRRKAGRKFRRRSIGRRRWWCPGGRRKRGSRRWRRTRIGPRAGRPERRGRRECASRDYSSMLWRVAAPGATEKKRLDSRAISAAIHLFKRTPTANNFWIVEQLDPIARSASKPIAFR